MAKPTVTAYYLQGSSTTQHALTPVVSTNPTYLGLSYIQSTGTQCFDSGVHGSENIRVVIDFELTNVDARKIFGAWESSGTARHLSYAGAINSSKHAAFFHRANTGTVTAGTVAAAANTRYVYDMDGPARTVTVNGTTSVTLSNAPAGAITRGTMMILNNRQNATIQTSNGIRAKMYSCKIYENGILIRDFIPVKRVSDDAIGVFDKIRQVFCPNVGSGTFTAGDLNTSNDLYMVSIVATAVNELKTSNHNQWKTLRVLGWYNAATNQLMHNSDSYNNDSNRFIVYTNVNSTYYCKIAENPITISIDNPTFGTATYDVASIVPDYLGLECLSSHNSDYIKTNVPVAEIDGFYAKFISHDRISSSDYGCVFGGRYGSLDNDLQLTSYASGSSFIGTYRRFKTAYNAGFNNPGTLNEITHTPGSLVSNGASAIEINTSAFTYNNVLDIFALNNNGTVTQAGIVDLYRLKIRSNEAYIMDLVPAIRRSDFKLGLADKIRQNFNVNEQATDTFTYTKYNYNNNVYKITLTATTNNDSYFAGWYNSSNQLISKEKIYVLHATPEDFSSISTIYARFSKINVTVTVNNSNYGTVTGDGGCPVVYNGHSCLITGSARDYIDTGFKPSNLTRVKMRLGNYPRRSNYWAFGARTSSSSKQFGFLCSGDDVYRTDFHTANKSFATTVSYSGKMIIDKNKNVCTLTNDAGGVSNAQTNTNGEFTADYTLYLLSCNNAGTAPSNVTAGIQLYTCRIWEDGSLKYDFVPVKKWNSTEVGLWEKRHNRFYPTALQVMTVGPDDYENNAYSTTLRAQAKAGATFEGWYDSGGNLVSTLPSYTIYPTENVTYEARFFAGEVASLSTSLTVNGDSAVLDFDGTTYVNPNVKLADYPNLRIVAEASLKDTSTNNWIIGAVDPDNNYILMGYSGASSKFRIQGGTGGSEIDFTDTPNTQPHKYVLNYINGKVSFDGGSGTNFTASSTNTAPIIIGACCNKKTNTLLFARCYVYKIQMYNGDTMIRDLHPQWVSGYGWGLLDEVNKVFYPQSTNTDASAIN